MSREHRIPLRKIRCMTKDCCKKLREIWMGRGYSKKGYLVDTFLFIRLINPNKTKNSQKIFVFRQELEVWCSHYSSNLISVETFW